MPHGACLMILYVTTYDGARVRIASANEPGYHSPAELRRLAMQLSQESGRGEYSSVVQPKLDQQVSFAVEAYKAVVQQGNRHPAVRFKSAVQAAAARIAGDPIQLTRVRQMAATSTRMREILEAAEFIRASRGPTTPPP